MGGRIQPRQPERRADGAKGAVNAAGVRGHARSTLDPFPLPCVAMQSLDGPDLAGREATAAGSGEPAELDAPVADAMQPLDPEAQRLRQATHDPVAPVGERELELDPAWYAQQSDGR